MDDFLRENANKRTRDSDCSNDDPKRRCVSPGGEDGPTCVWCLPYNERVELWEFYKKIKLNNADKLKNANNTLRLLHKRVVSGAVVVRKPEFCYSSSPWDISRHFKLLEPLGLEGGFGQAYRAECKACGRFLAIKVMYKGTAAPELLLDKRSRIEFAMGRVPHQHTCMQPFPPTDEYCRRRVGFFRREIDIMRHLQHENVVDFIDFYEGPSQVWIVMELCTGGELWDLIEMRNQLVNVTPASRKGASQHTTHSHQTSTGEAPDHKQDDQHPCCQAMDTSDCQCLCLLRDITRQMLCAIQYLHKNIAAHFDITPSNFVLVRPLEIVPGCRDLTCLRHVRRRPQIRLIDFGLSRVFVKRPLPVMVGNVTFRSPEMLVYGQCTEQTDMWSLGLVLYVLLHLSVPFNATQQQLRYAKGMRALLRSTECVRRIHNLLQAKINGTNCLQSKAANHLILCALTVDPSRRITAQQALRHPWISLSRDRSVCKMFADTMRRNYRTPPSVVQLALFDRHGHTMLDNLHERAMDHLFALADVNKDARITFAELSALLNTLEEQEEGTVIAEAMKNWKAFFEKSGHNSIDCNDFREEFRHLRHMDYCLQSELQLEEVFAALCDAPDGSSPQDGPENSSNSSLRSMVETGASASVNAVIDRVMNSDLWKMLDLPVESGRGESSTTHYERVRMQVGAFIRSKDKNNDGQLCFEEFKDMFWNDIRHRLVEQCGGYVSSKEQRADAMHQSDLVEDDFSLEVDASLCPCRRCQLRRQLDPMQKQMERKAISLFKKNVMQKGSATPGDGTLGAAGAAGKCVVDLRVPVLAEEKSPALTATKGDLGTSPEREVPEVKNRLPDIINATTDPLMPASRKYRSTTSSNSTLAHLRAATSVAPGAFTPGEFRRLSSFSQLAARELRESTMLPNSRLCNGLLAASFALHQSSNTRAVLTPSEALQTVYSSTRSQNSAGDSLRVNRNAISSLRSSVTPAAPLAVNEMLDQAVEEQPELLRVSNDPIAMLRISESAVASHSLKAIVTTWSDVKTRTTNTASPSDKKERGS